MLNATSLRGTDRKTKNLLNARPSLVASLSTSLKSNVQTQRTLAFLVLLPLRALVPVRLARHAAVRTQLQQHGTVLTCFRDPTVYRLGNPKP